MTKKIALCLALLLLLSLAGCKLPNSTYYSMPFNGDVTFHDISVTIPESYIRDSTQSNDDFWMFEKQWYSSTIMLLRRDAAGNVDTVLNDYRDYLIEEQGATSERTLFLGQEAVLSKVVDEDSTWQELYFVYNGSMYAVAVRGKDTDDFDTLLESVTLPAQAS